MRQTVQLGKLDQQGEIRMKACGYKGCKFKTNKPTALNDHRRNAGHDGTPRQREFRGDKVGKFKKSKR